MSETFTGKVWVLGDDIDTDIIIPTEYLALKTVQDMAPYAFSPLRPELASQIKPGDMIVAGKNFGCGSSREQALEIIKALGIRCVIARSFARIFFRNSINNGLLLIEQPTLYDDIKEGDTISTGKHTLAFAMIPMVHWPEVMMEYESTDKVLFSADGFGKFGALDTDEDWTCEARRYYFNIVGKYGAQVQAVLKKAAGLDIEKICPLHGPILTENLGFYIDKYNTWSSYQPEDEGILVACASIHGNTKKAAELLAEKLKATGVKVAFTDLCRDDMAEAVEDAFRYDRLVLCACTYDGGIFPPMEDFLHHLKAKAYQNRKIAFVENGSWAPTAARQMKAIVEGFKNIECVEPVVTIKSTLNEASEKQMDELVAALTK